MKAHVNNRMMNIRRDVTQMANGMVPLDLRGLTLASMNPGRIWEDGDGNWRAVCRKCGGSGVPVMEYEEMKEDVKGRGKEFCFACQGKGHFYMVKPEEYLKLVKLWVFDRLQYQGKYNEIKRLCSAEIEYMRRRDPDGEESWLDDIYQFWIHVSNGESYVVKEELAVERAWERQDGIKAKIRESTWVRKELASQGMPEGWIQVLLLSHGL